MAFVAVADGKASLVVGVTDDLTARISAVDLVRLGAEALGGKGGGGRPDMAQAGGPDAERARRSVDRDRAPRRGSANDSLRDGPGRRPMTLRRRVYYTLEGGRAAAFWVPLSRTD